MSGAEDAEGGTIGEIGKRKQNDETGGTWQKHSESGCDVTPKVARYQERCRDRTRKRTERWVDEKGKDSATKQNYRSVHKKTGGPGGNPGAAFLFARTSGFHGDKAFDRHRCRSATI